MDSGSDAAGSIVSTPEPSVRYRTLDAWRGVACVLLVVYHSTLHAANGAEPGETWWDKLGYHLLKATACFHVGVPIFFVISGYCIMATLDRRCRHGDGVGRYFWRRFYRIYPPYWIALLIASFVILISERFFWPGLFTRSDFKMTDPTRLSLLEWLGNLTLTESWRFHLTGGAARFLVAHAWTLCYEEQFYAIAGAILLLAPRKMFLTAVVITLSIPFLVCWAHRCGIPLEGTIIGIAWLYFAAGIAAYYRVHYAGKVGRLITSAMFSVAIFVPAFDWRHLMFSDSLRFSWIISMTFALLLAALHRKDAQLSSWQILFPFLLCGRMCYSLYLIHPLVTTGIGHAFYQWGLVGSWQTLLVTLPVSLVLSLAISALFFILVERRFLSSGHRSRNKVTSHWELI